VPDYQLSLAIGKEGQNARLAARLTGWRIDIRSDAAAPTTRETPQTAQAADTTQAAEATVDVADSSAQVSPGVGDVRTR
jgi:N utilization substance protein A